VWRRPGRIGALAPGERALVLVALHASIAHLDRERLRRQARAALAAGAAPEHVPGCEPGRAVLVGAPAIMARAGQG
jgi:alkylhydroperoxidase/carboxymuconolactone decarboxylase family protein YurZ